MAAICVFCGSSETLDEGWLELSRQTGEAIAARGHALVSGGGSVGMMGALARGARAGGGHTIGVIPQSLVDLEVADVDADELVITDGMAARKVVMIERSNGFIALPGGLGTLDELFEVWTTSALGLHTKPLVLLDWEGFYQGLVTWLVEITGHRFVREEALSTVHVADSISEALDVIERFG